MKVVPNDNLKFGGERVNSNTSMLSVNGWLDLLNEQ